MNRPKRVLSFMTQWGGNHGNESSAPSSPTTATSSTNFQPPPPVDSQPPRQPSFDVIRPPQAANSVPQSPSTPHAHERSASQPGSRAGSRRNSLALGYQPPVMEVNQDTPAELQPIFSFLNSHSNKLYQEGYFLKLHDLDYRGKPSTDRVWNECFAQLVGTVLSLWDAAQLDAAGEDGEVIPTFINLTDASLKMIESLPMNGQNGEALQNVLSISTAANNRYLLHFNSLHSLTQWTAGIRLAMFEHATLQESYTGSILAGKGKHLNSINQIMERARFPTEDWARVRFGAGTPWRRCWCVISPPDEKAFAKAQKNNKKKSAYDRSPPTVKGDIKFYESRKVTKKSMPIATITDAFSAYALYPQSKPLIEQSTLVKVEGMITIHATHQTTTEGFIFVMPEPHPAISGFEMMLRWLMPCYDTFALYGRPNKLIADVLDNRSLMFAMPTHRRYGYLELIDVAGLIHTDGSSRWSEREWRKQLKILTSKRMTSQPATVGRAGTDTAKHQRRGSRSSVNLSSMSRTSLNLPPSRGGVAFADEGVSQSTPNSRNGSPALGHGTFGAPPRTDSAPMTTGPYNSLPHQRSVSEKVQRRQNEPSRLSSEQHHDERPPPPPPHATLPGQNDPRNARQNDVWHDAEQERSSEHSSTPDREHYAQSNGNGPFGPPPVEHFQPNNSQPLQPFQAPPTMAHKGGQRPPRRPNQMPDLRRANSHVDAATLAQLADVSRAGRGPGAPPHDTGMYQPQHPPQPPTVQGPYRGPDPGPNYSPSGPPRTNGGNLPIRDRRAPPAGHSGPPSGMPPARLATIPGTPAMEQPNQFDMPGMGARRPSAHREGSSGSVQRRPLPERVGAHLEKSKSKMDTRVPKKIPKKRKGIIISINKKEKCKP